MLLAGPWWYGVVPGVTRTGPFNPHFVKDIGATYLVAAAGLAWRASRPGPGAAGAVLGASAFLGLHALIHLSDAAVDGGGLAEIVRDFPGVFAPALLAIWIAFPGQPRKENR